MKFSVFLLFCILALTACTKDGPKKNESEISLYNNSQKYLKQKKYSSAIEYLQAIENRFPFGEYAVKANLDKIYAYYNNDEIQAAKATAERFIKLQSGHENIDYAYYVKALTSFYMDRTLFDSIAQPDQSLRDVTNYKRSLNEFKFLVDNFPESKYVADASKRIMFLEKTIAKHELYIAEFNLENMQYIAALNRANYIIENYNDKEVKQKALTIAMDASNYLGIQDLKQNYLQNFQEQYPNKTYSSHSNSFIEKLFEAKPTQKTPQLEQGMSSKELKSQFKNTKSLLKDELGSSIIK